MSRLGGDGIQASVKFLKSQLLWIYQQNCMDVLQQVLASVCLYLGLTLCALHLLFGKAITDPSLSLLFCCRLDDLGEFQLNNLISNSTGVIFCWAEKLVGF